MDIGHEALTDEDQCADGIELMEQMEVANKLKFSIYCETASVNTDCEAETNMHHQPADMKVVTDKADEELNCTMHHVINAASYPFTCQPDDDQLNASIMIDPSNPFDEDMIERFLSKLAQPLSSYKNYHYVDSSMPKICARGSIQLGII